MADITDVRRALWNAYKQAAETGQLEGKSSEAWCEVQYPTYWDADGEDKFLQPCGLMVYSYALGPSREHYFKPGKFDREINYYTWQAPDIYAKAVEVINGWLNEFMERVAEDAE